MELLIAASMTLVVVGVAGWALVTVTKTNKIAKATSEMQYDFNRAVDFMAEEIKGSQKIATDLSETGLATVSKYFYDNIYDSNSMTPIIAFKVDDDLADQYVVYYLLDTEKTSYKEVWGGRYVLYRWGPPYGQDGKYKTYDHDTNNTTPEIIKPPSDWGGSGFALVDLVLDTWETEDYDKRRCRRKYVPGDGEEWKRYPYVDTDYDDTNDANDQKIKGFFICVPTAGELAGQQAEIHAYGQIEATGSKNAYLGKGHNLKYGVVTNVFLRGGQASLDHGGNTLITLFDCPPGSASCPDLVSNKELTLQVEYIHGSCEIVVDAPPNTPPDLGASATYYRTPQPIEPATEIAFAAMSPPGGVCQDGAWSTVPENYITAADGTALTDITGETNLSDTHASNLKSILESKGLVKDGKLDLKSNQFLGFFEASLDGLNPDESSNTNYDDAIIKVTVESVSP